MAEKPLKGIKFPGLYGTYEIPQVDTTLTVSGAAAEAKKVGDELAKKADAIEDTDHPGCYYRMVAGKKEWINPPIVDGVEYRTTKRRNGKVVYDKCIDLGTLPANGEKSTGYFGSGSTSVWYEAYVKTKSDYIYPMPFFTADGTNGANVYATKWSIVVAARYDVSAHTGFAIVHYTKD